MKRTRGLTLVALLALVQGVAGLLHAARVIKIGSDLASQAVSLPIIGRFVIANGVIVAAIAILYVLFAWCAMARGGWAWFMGLAAVIANALAVLSLLLWGAPAGEALVWAIVPAVLVAYLFSPAGRHAVGNRSRASHRDGL